MIQRIQSLFLLLAAVIMLPLYSQPLARLQISDTIFLHLFHNRVEAFNQDMFTDVSTWPVTTLLTAMILISLFTFFSYKKRIRQIRLCVFNIILHFGFIGLVYFYTKYTLNLNNGVQSVFLWPVIFPFLSVLLNYLALKRIQKDELLIRSMDRLRR